MLRSLEIRDILLIDRLDLDFQPGLNVLTGETGAGKSILLDSLGFVLGWRGRGDLVRQGAEQGEVTAVFDIPGSHPAVEILREADMDPEGDLIIRRTNSAQGRKSAWINDRRVSGEILRQVSETLVELHGQHDDRGLLDPKSHRSLLDQFAGVDLAAVRAPWNSLRAAEERLSHAKAQALALAQEEEFLRHAVAELEAMNPQAGEEATLDQDRRRMQAFQKMRADVTSAQQALGLNGAETLVMDAMRWLDGAAEGAEGQLDPAIEAVSLAIDAIGEAETLVRTALDEMAFDPFVLEQTEERLFALRALARKHAVSVEGLPAQFTTLSAKLENLDNASGEIADLERAVSEASDAYEAAAQALSLARKAAGERLAAAMQAELAPLKMERAVFAVDITPEKPGPEGRDRVRFQVATNPGAPMGELGKIASGGELSRFLLALKVCLLGTQSGVTMIFDEIDRGVGGATADAVGRRLAELAARGQVLVVTHSPQVAALGAHHWRVSKHQTDDQTISKVEALDPKERIEEIARMLSGETVTETARAAAQELLRP